MMRLSPLLTAVLQATVLSMAISGGTAWADVRVALVIGNSSYQAVQKLSNPVSDANAVAQMFREAHFDTVDVGLDLSAVEFKRALRKFEQAADQADTAVIYYSGYGLKIRGTNYLIPVDARRATDRDADNEAIPLERMVSSADGAKKLRVIILDSSRNNPFSGRLKFEREASDNTASSGLGKVEPTSDDTLIAYAAKAGSTAEDGEGDHSPFTTAILKSLTVPGLDIRLAFGRVKDEVMRSTAGRQEPYVYGSLGGDTYALVPVPTTGTKEVSLSEMRAVYEVVESINTRRAWEVFLDRYKTGMYAELARVKLARLSASQDSPDSVRAPVPK